MCGILGSLPSVSENRFRLALDMLAHRGPDGEGIWSNEEKNISLGNRRLAILDVSERGAMPMHNERYAITYNGELYNFPELRKELEQLGHQFKTNTDTEVVLTSWMQWGEKALGKFNGMWAFAIWDKQDKKLILSRDRFGKKPLYFIHDKDQFVFASEMKALVPFLKEVEVAEDFQWMKENLFDYEPTEKCLIKGIKRFPAASWGVFQNGELKTFKYWDTLEHIHRVPKNYKDQVAEFRELFIDACKIRMRSDVSLGTALSGGIDSSATICTMAHVGKNDLNKGFKNDWQHAFVASFPGTPLDETYYAKKVTDHLKIPASFIEMDAQRGIDDLEESLFQFEELYITSPVPMMQTYAAARKAGVYVTLDGHGADELFAGYDTFLFHAFRDCGLNPFAIQNILETYRGLIPPDDSQFKKQEVGFKNYLRWVAKDDKLKALKPHLKEEIKKIFSDNSIFQINKQKVSLEDLGHLNSALFELFHTKNLPTLLRNYDRYSMAHGVEIRMPFLDHRIVSYCFSIPWTSKLRNGYTKSLLRDAVADLMPKEVAYRKWKMGFQTPIVNWLKGPWKQYFLDTINSKNFAETKMVNAPEVKSKIEKVIHENVSYREGELAYAAISPYLWEKAVLRRFRKIKDGFTEF